MKKTENYSEDEKYMVLAVELAKKGFRVVRLKGGWGSDRKRWLYYWSGIP